MTKKILELLGKHDKLIILALLIIMFGQSDLELDVSTKDIEIHLKLSH